MKIAIMQPYFYPYRGYFDLFANTDLFVIYDCVQFIRRGWIHRNKLPDSNGELQWLTLPLAKVQQTAVIKDIMFHENAKEMWQQRLLKFPLLSGRVNNNDKFIELLSDLDGSLVDYLIKQLKFSCHEFGFHHNVVRSCELNIGEPIKGQDRILTICKYFGAKEYINLPGGRELYDEDVFADKGIKLSFLDTARYDKISTLEFFTEAQL